MTVIYGYGIYWMVALIGITFGYHRYFAHSFYYKNSLIEIIMLYAGLLCGGRSALTWAGVHRMHHAYADTEKDPHSSKNYPWYVILFSLWRVETIPRKFIKDLIRNPRVMFFHKYGIYIFVAHWVISFLTFGWNAVIINSMLLGLSYLGFGILNLFGHNLHGPVNNIWINLIAPLEGNHRDHHEHSQRT